MTTFRSSSKLSLGCHAKVLGTLVVRVRQPFCCSETKWPQGGSRDRSGKREGPEAIGLCANSRCEDLLIICLFIEDKYVATSVKYNPFELRFT